MEREQAKSVIEAVLFASGGAVEIDSLAVAAESDRETAERLAKELAEEYDAEKRGMAIIRLEDSFQMCTRKEYYAALIRVVAQPKRHTLSDAALEALAIIAYKQPVTRTEIDQIRGVKSDHAVNRLVEYGLIEEAGRVNAPGRPILFRTTEEFLRGFGIASLSELPVFEDAQKEAYKEEAIEEVQMALDFPD